MPYNKNMSTPNEQHDTLRVQVEREIPRPVGGFETDEAEDLHRWRQDERFMALCRAYAEKEETTPTPTPTRKPRGRPAKPYALVSKHIFLHPLFLAHVGAASGRELALLIERQFGFNRNIQAPPARA